MKKNNNHRWTGRAVILATLLAICAALIPSQASAALPKKVTSNNDFSVVSCSFAKEKVDLAAGTMTLKITANARPKGFNGFKNIDTLVLCAAVDPGFTAYTVYEVFQAKTTINQVRRVDVNIADIGSLCADSYTEQKSGATSGGVFSCIPA